MECRLERDVQTLTRTVLVACRRAWLVAAAFSIAINLLMLTVPVYMLQLFDRVLLSRSADTLVMLSVMALVALVSLAALDIIRGLLLARLGLWVEQKLGGYLLASHIADAAQQGRIGVHALRDLTIVRRFLSGPGITPLFDAPWTPLFLLAIFVLHPILGWVASLGAVGLVLMIGCAESAVRPMLLAKEKSSFNTDAAEGAVRNASVIEAMGMVPAVVRRWQGKQHDSLLTQRRVAHRAVLIFGISKFLRLILQVAVFGIGAYLAIHNEITAGALVASSILVGRALAPVEMAIGGWRGAVDAFGAYQRIRKELENASIARPTMSLPFPAGRLLVQQLTFGYHGSSRPVLRGIGFVVEPGAALGLLGPAAAGKTTLARLLTGTLRPQLGHVRLDGVDVAETTPQDRARGIGYLPQDVELLGGTVRENIARFQEEASDEEVVRAAQLVSAHQAILRLPNGYGTVIGENGVALSGGQRQLIALARAVFGRPKFVILDEPNSNLDSEGEVGLHAAIKALKAQGTTVVVIAHLSSLLKQMDKLIVLKEGQISAFGPPSQVLSNLIQPAADLPKPQPSSALGYG